jgi:SHAQKYF class myb-like DNA-binding protein
LIFAVDIERQGEMADKEQYKGKTYTGLHVRQRLRRAISRTDVGAEQDAEGGAEPVRANGSFLLDEDLGIDSTLDGQVGPESYADRLEKLSLAAGSDKQDGAGAGGGNNDKVVGRWTDKEQAAFITGLKKFGRNWKDVQGLIKTRTLTQIRTHAQKFFRKVKKERELAAERGDTNAVQNLTRLLETGPLHPNSACHRQQVPQKKLTGIRPRTNHETGEHLRLASSDVLTPSHLDKRTRGFPGGAFQEIDPRVPRLMPQASMMPPAAPEAPGPGRAQGWMSLERTMNERTGEWSFHEENYTNKLIQEFQAGRLALADRTLLLRFLISSLQVAGGRIQAKYGVHCDLHAEYRHRLVPECEEERAERAEDVAELRTKYFDELKLENMQSTTLAANGAGAGGGGLEASPFYARAAAAAAEGGGGLVQNTSNLKLSDLNMSDSNLADSDLSMGQFEPSAEVYRDLGAMGASATGQLRTASGDSLRSQNFSLSGLFDDEHEAAELAAMIDGSSVLNLGGEEENYGV